MNEPKAARFRLWPQRAARARQRHVQEHEQRTLQERNELLESLLRAYDNQLRTWAPLAPTTSPPAVQRSAQTLRSRDSIDHSLPLARAALAILCWVNSYLASGITLAEVETLTWRFQHPGLDAPPLAWKGFVIGLALQAILTAVQVYSAERNPRTYFISLLPDAGMTMYQWWQWLLWPTSLALASQALPPVGAWWAALALSVSAGWIIGVYSARLPEVLVFGPRRKV